MGEANKSKISNVEWGLFIGALVVVDLTQVLLEWLLVGLFLNPFVIDPIVGMSIPFYMSMRGEKVADTKRILGLLASFVGELIPGVDEFPLWSLYGVYLFMLSRAENVVKQVPGLNNATSLAGIPGTNLTPNTKTGSAGQGNSSSSGVPDSELNRAA